MVKPSKSYQEFLLASLQDKTEAVEYLNAALEEGDLELFLLALRNVAESRVASQSQLNREHLYRMLSEQGNPRLSSLTVLLDILDLRLVVQLKKVG